MRMQSKDIIMVLQDHLSKAVGNSTSLTGELERERENVQGYYDGHLPKRIHRGQSSYVSEDVWAAVEHATAQILDTFSMHQRMVHFTPTTAKDVQAARVATEYCSHIIHQVNSGDEIFENVARDGFKARIGFSKVYWRQETRTVTETLDPMTAEELVFWEKENPNYDTSGLEYDEDQGVFSGQVTREENVGNVQIDPVKPEDISISARAVSLDKPDFISHRSRKTYKQLLDMGYKAKLLDEIKDADKDDRGIGWSSEEDLRHADIDGGSSALFEDENNRNRKKITVHESYVLMSEDEDDMSQTSYWQYIWAGDVVLSKQQVLDHPFVCYVPIRKEHSLWGSPFTRPVIQTQNSKTMLLRGILDHTAITTNPRWTVLNKGINDIRELTDNRLGGVVNIQRQDAVQPLVQPPMNPFVMNTLSLLNSENETKSGVSALSQGLNKEAISAQNSAALEENVRNAGQTRQKQMARNFAYGYLIPLYRKVFRLVIENEDREKVVRVAGSWVNVKPGEWHDRVLMHAEPRLGYGESDREIERLMMLHQMFIADTEVQHLYGPEKRYEVMRRIMELQGIKDVETFLAHPEQAPKKEDPAAQMQMQMAMKEMELKERQQALKEAEFQHKSKMELAKMRLEDGKVMSQITLNEEKADLAEDKHQHDKMVDMAEVEIMRKQAEATSSENSKLTTIVSANS